MGRKPLSWKVIAWQEPFASDMHHLDKIKKSGYYYMNFSCVSDNYVTRARISLKTRDKEQAKARRDKIYMSLQGARFTDPRLDRQVFKSK